MLFFTFVCIVVTFFLVLTTGTALPTLNIDGFAWAENLAFDGIGGLYVSEAVRGQLWRISLDKSGANYTSEVYITKGFKQFGGLAPTGDGKLLYAAAVFEDKSFGILSTSTTPSKVGPQPYNILTKEMSHLANGMALVEADNALYSTSESGTLSRIDLSTGKEVFITTDLAKPDGLWYDTTSGLLFVCELVTKRMKVYNVKEGKFSEYYAFASQLGELHLIDDISLVSGVDSQQLDSTLIVGADWTGRQIVEMSLDGKIVKSVPVPEGITLFEPTSIRRGKGPGFDSNSFYITEGGGLTRNASNRRVLQLVPGSI